MSTNAPTAPATTGMMRAISLWQPWASAMAYELKRIETRGWATNYRGDLVIHAAKRWTRDEFNFLELAPLEYLTTAMTLKAPPLGALVAVVHLDNCVPTLNKIGLSEQEEFWGQLLTGPFWLVDIKLPSVKNAHTLPRRTGILSSSACAGGGATAMKRKPHKKPVEAFTAIPIYGMGLYLYINEDPNAVLKKTKRFKGKSSRTNYAFMASDGYGRFALCFKYASLRHSNIAHEIYHATNHIMAHVSAELYPLQHEPHAYLCGWITAWLYKQIEKMKIPVLAENDPS